MDSELYNLERSDTTCSRNTAQAILRFLRLVFRHRMIVLGFLAAAVFVGIVRYKRTPSVYEASAKMMLRNIIYTTSDTEHRNAMHGLLASYKQLLLSDVVLVDAIKSLERPAPELQGTSSVQWPAILRSMLTVSFDPKENIVEVSCRSRDPESTVSIIRAISKSSAEFIENDRHSMTHQLVGRLDDERLDLQRRLDKSRTELLSARKACGDVSSFDGSDESHPTVKRVSELSSQLTESRSRRVELESMLRTVQSLLATGQDLSQILPLMEPLVGAEVIQRIQNFRGISQTLIEEAEASLHTLESEIVAMKQHFGTRHPEITSRIVRKNELLRWLNVSRQANRNRFTGGIRDPQVAQWMISTVSAEYQRTLQHQQLLKAEYELAEQDALALNDQLEDVRMAERAVETLQKQYASILNRLSSIEIGKDEGGISVAALNEPLIPGTPSAPVLSHHLGISTVLGLFASLALIYVIDLIDDRLRSPEDVQNQLGLSVLGVIRPIPVHESESHPIHVHGHPLSAQTECFRTIRTSITLCESETRCLAVTSSEQSEGKTTLIANLAATFAQTGSRTLLIDADMRRPGLSKLLEMRGQGGLSEVLGGNDNVPQMCRERTISTEVPRLDILPCGLRKTNAGVLLSMPALSAVVDWAVAEYDQVLIDCPPVLPVSDASIVGNFVDGMLFLLNPEKTHRRSALRAVDQLRSLGMNLVGVVTNTSSEAHTGAYEYGYGPEYTYGQDEHGDAELPDGVIPGATFANADNEQQPYSLLSDNARDRSDSRITGEFERKAA